MCKYFSWWSNRTTDIVGSICDKLRQYVSCTGCPIIPDTIFSRNIFFSGVSNFLRRSFYKLCLRKEILCYYWNQFGGRVHVGGRRCFKFYSQNTNLLPPKPKSTFRHLKQGIQDFHGKYVLVPADKAANNVVVVWRLHYINTLKQELSGTKAYKETSEEEKSVVNGHCNHLALKFSVCVKERQADFLRCIGYLSFTKDRIKHDLLQLKFLYYNWTF